MDFHGEDVPTVRVLAVKDGPTIVLAPLDNPSKELLATIVTNLDERAEWRSGGSKYRTPGAKDLFIGMFISAGGTYGRRTEGNVTYGVYRGAVDFYLELSDDTDETSRYALRDYGYYCGFVVRPDSTPSAVSLMANERCKVCSGVLNQPGELEWRVCNQCSSVCEHLYKQGIGQANGQIAWLPFCERCGRGDPDWQPSEDPIEDLVNTVAEGGLNMLILNHPDGGKTTISRRSTPEE